MSKSVFVLILLFAAPLWALETDQFTVPAKPLTDLGAQLDAKIYAELAKCVDAANATRQANLASAERAKTTHWQRIYARRAAEAVTPQAIADDFYSRVATAEVPRCKIEKWLEDEHSGRGKQLLNTGIRESIYGGPFERPLLLVEVSPTVNLYGQYVGVDKVGHFVQQGHEYYDEYTDEIEDGKIRDAAVHAAVAHGVGQEHGFYGEITIGVYSNADLAANYAGLLFYRNLTETIQIGDQTVAPMIEWDGQTLKLTDRAKDGPTKPFITEHWSEAMNPCRYASLWRRSIRAHVAERIAAWMAFYHTTPDAERERLVRVQTFFGTPYGHLGNDSDLVTIVNAGPSPHEPITASAHE